MDEDQGQSENPVSDEMSEYLQVFLDETEEQLDDLVGLLLVLEREPDRSEELNEAFRLIHSIKGSAGLMGLDSISVLTHHLETRFEAFRSGVGRLDAPTMNLVLRCIDFLRECARRLRAGESLGSASDLLQQLTTPARDEEAERHPESPEAAPVASGESASVPEIWQHAAGHGDAMQVVVVFEPDLPLADLKARLIVSRLAALGEIASTSPDASALDEVEALDRFEVLLVTTQDPDTVRESVDLDGVRAVELRGAHNGADDPGADVVVSVSRAEAPPEPAGDGEGPETGTSPAGATEETAGPGCVEESIGAALDRGTERVSPVRSGPGSHDGRGAPDVPSERAKPKVAQTIRVDTERLDRLMNLAGELVVNRARFVQVSGQAGSSFRARNVVGRVRDFGDTLRRTIEHLQASDPSGEWSSRVEELRAGLEFLEEQSGLWDDGRKCFAQIEEAIDQLTRIADGLQQGVLDTRMVPVAPLFNRFNRVVRDLSIERGKRVHLEIHGEKTELDKRMIDELGDPLIHLVRNSLDHGLESPETRKAREKPEVGTIRLEASHSGNSVYISIRDDGEGINVARIREKIVERGLLTSAAAAELSEGEVLQFIWHAGFSTAPEVTDISGRGVGMDVVRTRIADLNGTVDVETTPEVGTTFTIRLPLTLAIINSLLVRIRDVIFSMPIDDVREIVSVRANDVVSVQGKQVLDVRGEFIPLIGVDELFDWHDVGHVGNGDGGVAESESTACVADAVAAVVLQVGERLLGLRVDELLGSQNIVIKSLSENFVPIRGLSGASILGDGTVCLMLDVGAVIELATGDARVGGSSIGVKA